MKKLLLVTAVLAIGSWAQAKNLSNPDSLSNYFQANPEAAKAFVAEEIENNSSLSEKEKLAYKALVGQSKEMSGDEVLEYIDEATLKAFYGYEEETETEGLLHNAAAVSSSQDVASCMMNYTLCVHVSKKAQRIYAYYNGVPLSGVHGKAVSTARKGKWTPVGTFSVGEIAGRWRVSGLYKGAALYYAMQLDGNIFIHATSEGNYGALGSPASAGCVRTHLATAEKLNATMRGLKKSQIRVVVTAN